VPSASHPGAAEQGLGRSGEAEPYRVLSRLDNDLEVARPCLAAGW